MGLCGCKKVAEEPHYIEYIETMLHSHEMILHHVRDALQIHGVAFSLIRESSASTRTARLNLTLRDLFDH
jgi:Zn-finger domain-containing protein